MELLLVLVMGAGAGIMILGASSMQVSLAGAAASSKLTLEDIAKSDKLVRIRIEFNETHDLQCMCTLLLFAV
jgi:hypothetical protein